MKYTFQMKFVGSLGFLCQTWSTKMLVKGSVIKELEKKVEAKVTRKPKKKKGDESARGADGV